MQQKFLFVLLGTFLFSSCLYDAVYNLDADELVWLEPYKQRDTVVFVSEQGKDMDTMIVDNKTLYNDHHALFRENEGSSVYTANGFYECTVFHHAGHFECGLLITKQKEDLMQVYLEFKERCLMFADEKELKMNRMVLNGVEYDDAIIVDDSNSEFLHNARYYCNYFIWSKSKGLIQYQYMNGDTYTFYKKLPYMKSKRRN